MSCPSAQQIPGWLAKHTSSAYMASVYRVLAERESERGVARYLSTAPVPGEGAATLSKRSRSVMQLPKMLRPTDTSTHYSVATGTQPENQNRNRYLDIQPYDRTRVIVDAGSGGSTDGDELDEGGKYLNASWVLERFGHKWWIASQAPLPNTVHTFLSLLLQPTPLPSETTSSARPRMTRIRTIVQLTLNTEHGRRKAHPYFPAGIGKSQTFLPEDDDSTFAIKVTLLSSTQIEDAHCNKSTLRIVPISLSRRSSSNGKSSRRRSSDDDRASEGVTVQHLLYTSWPDHGVPEAEDRAGLLAFLRLVDTTNRDVSLATPASPRSSDPSDLDPDPPIIVGCSAGVGRTGSFIALSSLMRFFDLLPPAHAPSPASILPASPLGTLPRAFKEDMAAQEVDSLREQRPGMVQRDEQVLLIYETLASALSAAAG